ncbi:hypothetical protein KFE80_04380 [bacterium SCSIO 12696]|nr:hypothetical protein KFE80_04380 [bacterium SCSIO 12696]
MIRFHLVLSIVFFAFTATTHAAQLKWVGSYDSGYKKGVEIISVQQSTARAALTISGKKQVDILSLENPLKPQRVQRISVAPHSGGDISSVAFHPFNDIVAVALIADHPLAVGQVLIFNATSGEQVATFEAGYWPDSVLFSNDGRWLAVANEGEPFVVGDKGELNTPPGSVTLIDIKSDLHSSVVKQIALPDLTGVDGVLQGFHKRSFERAVDLNEDGVISGDEEEIIVPITAADADYLEPEYLAFSPDGRELFVSLQENNAVLVVDVASTQVARWFGLGTTQHLADTQDDERISFTNLLSAFREPDGIAISADGRLLLTADEGDTEPKASKVKAGQLAGGGRTLSLFDAKTGQLLGDTGNQLDAMAHAMALYPDKRSDNKGSEPETVIYVELSGTPYAVVTLERADALALVNLKEPSKPLVEFVVPLREPGDKAKAYAPEGLALYRGGEGQYYVLCANEKRGTLSVVAVEP